MLRDLILKIIAAIAGIWLASEFVPGVFVSGSWQIFAWAGLILGLINYFIKPILKLITLPLQIITLGLFTIVINMAIIWLIDIIFKEISIIGIMPLFWTTLIVWIANLIVFKLFPEKKHD